jgi:hypothetical protein
MTQDIAHHEGSADAPAAVATEAVAARGARAFMGVAIAIVGVLAAANPNSPVLRALHHAMPQLAEAVPTLITTCGAVLAALSPPPKVRRRRM